MENLPEQTEDIGLMSVDINMKDGFPPPLYRTDI